MSAASPLHTWHARSPRADRVRRFLAGFAVVLLTLGLGAGLTTAAAAQEQEEEPEPTPLEFTQQAWYTNSIGKAVPNVLVETFPPQVLCLVVPPSCGPATEPVVEPLREEKNENGVDEDNAPTLPAQPFVQEGTLPAGRFGGTPRYASALQFEIPETPEGKEIDQFVLRVRQDQPTYSTDSPLFLQVVLAVLRGIQDQHPEATLEELMVALNDPEQYPPADTAPMRVEACPAQSEWEAGGNQAWDQRPEFGNCLLGNEGERKELDDGSVVYDFDLSTAVRKIAEGDDPNQGFFLHAFAAANTSYGDKEPTDAAQLSMSGPDSDSAPVALITYKDESGDGTFTLGSQEGSDGTSDSSTGDSSFDGSGTTSSSPSGTSGSSGTTSSSGDEAFSSAPAFETQSPPTENEPAPAVAAPESDQDSGGTGGDGEQAMAQQAGATVPVTPWYVWTLIPFGLAGMYMMSRALTAAPAVAAERKGAMSRLIEQRRQQGRPGAPQVQV